MVNVFDNWGRSYKSWLIRALAFKKKNPNESSMVGDLYLDGDDVPPMMCPKCWYTMDVKNHMTPLDGDKFVCLQCGHHEPF